MQKYTRTFASCLAAALSILFFGSNALAQTQTPWGEIFFNPSTQYQYWYAHCLNQYGQYVSYCNVTISSGYHQYTGGHIHDGPGHPYTSVSPTSGNTGCCGLPLTTTTKQVGQAEWIRVCGPLCSYTNQVVGYPDLQPVNTASYWVFVGSTPQHPDNHWGLVSATNAMQGLAIQYRNEYPNNPVVALNDSSLVRGGIFDINSNWVPDHTSHRRGGSFDVRGNGGPNSIPLDSATQQRFIAIALAFGALSAGIHSPGTQNQHFHIEWPTP